MHAGADGPRITMMGDGPTGVFPDEVRRTRGPDARAANILAARAVADAVRSTLGPKGLDKMLVDGVGEVSITNDGATILREMDVADPAARMIVETATTLEREVGDGTTTAVVLAGELLARAEALAEDLHPTLLAEGLRDAARTATRALEALARGAEGDREEPLRRAAATAMASKAAAPEAARFADLAVRAVIAVAEGNRADLAHVRIVKIPGRALATTDLVEGVVLEKTRLNARMPDRVDGARVALLEGALVAAKPQRAASIRLGEPASLGAFVAEEEARVAAEVRTLGDLGANALFVSGAIDDRAADLLSREGVFAVAEVGGETLAALARVTGATSAAKLAALTGGDLGRAGFVEEVTEGEAREVVVGAAAGARTVTLRVRGATEESVEEVARTLEDALGVARTALADGRLVPGAGAAELEAARALGDEGATLDTRRALVYAAFAEALEEIPRALAENAGLDPLDALVGLRAAHAAGRRDAGLDVATGEPVDAWARGIVEPLRVKVQCVVAAAELASMILRIDDVIATGGGSDRPTGRGP